MKSKDKSRL